MLKLRSVLINSKAAIDLASIMVGIIVIGLIGGVIAATVFAVIPWAQDNAAKQQLGSIHTAQNAAYGFSADPSRTLPSGQTRNSFTNSIGLDEGYGLLVQNDSYCTTAVGEKRDDYRAYSKSGSGEIFFASKNKLALPLPVGTPGLGECESWVEEHEEAETSNPTNPELPGTTPEVPATPPTPERTVYTDTSFTLNCSVNTNVASIISGLNGTSTWSDGTTPQTFTNGTPSSKTLTAGREYVWTIQGTFTKMSSEGLSVAAKSCFRSMNTWATDSGIVNASSGLRGMINLTDVPDSIPATVTDLSYFLHTSSSFNDSSVLTWDTSNVVTLEQTFRGASAFNQPIGKWNVNNVENLYYTFLGATEFNQPLDKWNVSNVTDMGGLFNNSKFNQNINNWNTSKVTDMSYMFRNNTVFNQPLDQWDTSRVTDFTSMFYTATAFDQNINTWNVDSATNMDSMFRDTAAFNQPLNDWETGSVTGMNSMFNQATGFNQDISGWDVSNVQNMDSHGKIMFAINSNLQLDYRPKFP